MVLAAAALLLTSIGGAAIFAAPITLPSLYFAARSSRSRSYRVVAGIVAALTAAELAWFGVYMSVVHSTALAWAVPLAAALITLGLFLRLSVLGRFNRAFRG